MDKEELRSRTKQFAVRVVKMVRTLPRTSEARVIKDQILRSATSVASNYRAACRARSKAEFLSKITIVLEEADESLFWLEMLIETDIAPRNRLDLLMREADEMVRIFGSTEHTLRDQIQNPKSQIPNRA